MRVLLVSPTALDFHGRPITQGRVHLPALTLPLLAAVTPRHVELRLVIETAERVPLEEHWDLVGLTGMGSGIVRAWQLADQFRERGVPVVIGGIAASLGEPAWTQDMLESIKTKYNVHIHAFSPPEMVHFSKLNGIPVHNVIQQLKASGLDSIPGGGAEILVDRCRNLLSPNKCTAQEWLDVMREAHKLDAYHGHYDVRPY